MGAEELITVNEGALNAADKKHLGGPKGGRLLEKTEPRAEFYVALRITVGRKCNQTCTHCHVDAGPIRTRLPLTLVYEPVGPKLPPDQVELEADYKRELKQRYGIEFTRLFTITNQPIARFADDLRAHGQWDAYLDLLANSFNPGTVSGLMCRSTISVGWRGEVFDCDFNQMLGMQLRNGDNLYLWDVTPHSLGDHPILTAKHCLACTAGAGSSCGGALTTNV